MNERGLEVFTAIVMGQTLRRAAELLNLTQSAVSRRLKELEEDLGSILVDRRKGLKASPRPNSVKPRLITARMSFI